MHRSFISHVEHGHRNLTLAKVCALLSALDMDIAEGFERVGREISNE